jgi:uncharacterized protein YyaL (SSP411 family)
VIRLAVAGLLVLAVACRPVAPSSVPSSGDRNLDRARALQTLILQDFQTSDGHLTELYPSASADVYATLWPVSQFEVAQLYAARLPGETRRPATLAAFEPYWDAAVYPPGYSASVVDPSATVNRKFFDDNAWIGLALLQNYHLTNDSAALQRARQVFDFTTSGWDTDPTHADPGGVWWSQQMPNPRFIHRNTISTAASSALALQLYFSSGGSDSNLLEWGRAMNNWVEMYLRGDNGLFGDHVDLSGQVDMGQLTYNQGIMVETDVLLYQATHDSAYLANARAVADTSLQVFGPDFNQQPAYNAVFFRGLLLLESQTGDHRYQAAIQSYADQVWDTLRDPATGLLNFVYGRNRTIEPHRLVDQAAMLQIYTLLALGPAATDAIT